MTKETPRRVLSTKSKKELYKSAPACSGSLLSPIDPRGDLLAEPAKPLGSLFIHPLLD